MENSCVEAKIVQPFPPQSEKRRATYERRTATGVALLANWIDAMV